MDPFFAARNRVEGAPWGKHKSYVEDVHRTYGGKLPKRDPEAFERALNYRARELEEWHQTRSERDEYAALLGESNGQLDGLTRQLNQLSTQYSKLKREYDEHRSAHSDEHPTPDGSGDGGILPVPDPRSADGSVGGEQLCGECVDSTPEVSADSGGQAGEHGTEGRLVGGSDTGGGVQVREEPVQEGSE